MKNLWNLVTLVTFDALTNEYYANEYFKVLTIQEMVDMAQRLSLKISKVRAAFLRRLSELNLRNLEWYWDRAEKIQRV